MTTNTYNKPKRKKKRNITRIIQHDRLFQNCVDSWHEPAQCALISKFHATFEFGFLSSSSRTFIYRNILTATYSDHINFYSNFLSFLFLLYLGKKKNKFNDPLFHLWIFLFVYLSLSQLINKYLQKKNECIEMHTNKHNSKCKVLIYIIYLFSLFLPVVRKICLSIFKRHHLEKQSLIPLIITLSITMRPWIVLRIICVVVSSHTRKSPMI